MRRFATFFSLLIFILFCALIILQMAPIQHAIKEYLETSLSYNSPYRIQIRNIHGLLPFSVTLEDIKIHQDEDLLCSIEEVRVVPSWIDFFNKELAFLKTTIKGVQLLSFPKKDQLSKNEKPRSLPNISLYSLQVEKVFLPNALKEELGIYDEETCFLSFSGSLFTDFSKKTANSKGSYSLFCQEAKIADLGCTLYVKEHSLSCFSSLIIHKTSWTPYIQKACLTEGSLYLNVSAKYKNLFRDITNAQIDLKSDYTLAGTWKSHLAVDRNSYEKFNDVRGILLEGTIFSRNSEIQIDTKNISTLLYPMEDLTIPPLTFNGTFSTKCSFVTDELEKPFSVLFRAPYLNFFGTQVNDVQLNSTISMQDDEIELDINGSLNTPLIEKKSCDILIHSVVAKDRIDVHTAHLMSDDAIINSCGRYDRCNNTYTGLVNAHLPRLSDIHYKLQGEALLDICFSFEEEQQKMSSDLILKNVISPHFSCAKGDVHIEAPNLFTLIDTSIEGTFEGIKSDDTHINTIQITTKVPTKSRNWVFPVQVLLEVPFKGDVAKARLESIIQLQPEKSDFFIRSKTKVFQIQHPLGLIKNSEPILSAFGSNALEIKPFSLVLDDVPIVKGDASVTDSQVSGHLFCQKIPLELLNMFSKTPWIDGSIACDLQWYGKPWNPVVISQISVQDASLFTKGHTLFAPCTGYSTTRIENNHCFSKGQLTGAVFKQPLSWDLSFPYEFSTGSISLPNQGSCDGEIDLGLYFERQIEENEEIQGLCQFSFTFHDKDNHPHVLGEIEIKDGFLNILKTGGVFSDLEMKIGVNDSVLTAHSIKATDGQDGTYTGSGNIEFSFEKNFPFELRLEASRCLLIDVDYATGFADGAATLSGDLTGAVLTGLFIGKNAEFFLDVPFSINAPKIPITFINSSEELFQKNPSKFELELDLDIDIPNKGFITGLGVESEWQGHAKIYGSPNLIRVFGEINLIKGTIAFLDKKFLLSKGVVEFEGDLLKESRLNILADIKSSQLIGGVYVRGNLETPRFAFYSTPTMSEKEILCHILFNKSASEISPVEGLQLAQVILKLYGKDQSIDVFDTIKKTLRLDRIASSVSNGPQQSSRTNAENLATEATNPQQNIANAISLQIGKYISEGIMVTLSKDVSKEANRIGIEAQVTEKLTAEAAIGDDSEGQVSLKWKHQY